MTLCRNQSGARSVESNLLLANFFIMNLLLVNKKQTFLASRLLGN